MNRNYPNFTSLLAKINSDKKYSALNSPINDLQECWPADLSYHYGRVEGAIHLMYELNVITEEEVIEFYADLYGTNVCEENKEGDET